jgi:uncharacterized glyoxalase superfamily protein PhnB
MPKRPRSDQESVMHAHVKIGDSIVMIADESEMAKATAATVYLISRM